MVSFADSPFKFLLLPPSPFLDPWRYCIQCAQNVECSGGTERFVGSYRQKQHLRPLCGTICKCELYCLSKRTPHFIDQQVITFHYVLRSNLPTQGKRPKVHFPLFLKTRISTNEAHVFSSFTASFHPFSLKFVKNVTR